MHAVGVRHAQCESFLMTTDAEIALASSWQRTMTRDKLSVCLGLFIQRLTPRVRELEKRWGQKRQGEDVEELVAKAEEQHLDADVEVPAHKSWRREDASNATDAADAAPEQLNSFVQSKAEVLDKIEESLRPLCMV